MYLKHGHFERLQNIKVEICGMETKTKKQNKKVLKRVSPVLGHSYNTAWIQR